MSARLINLPSLALWKETFDVPKLEISLPTPSECLCCDSPFRGVRTHYLGICVCYRERVQFL
jgi:hypothetical protein